MDMLRGLGASASSTWLARTGGMDDGDTEDDSYHMRVLHAYYRSPEFLQKGRPVPSWMPPDPKAPLKPAPVQMVSSTNVLQPAYGTPSATRPAETASLRSRHEAAPGLYTVTSKTSFIDSLPRNTQPVAAAAPAAPLSGAAKLKARYNQRGASPNGAHSLRSQASHEGPMNSRDDGRWAGAGAGGHGRDAQHTGGSYAPAAPTGGASTRWNSGGDEYNGYSAYGNSNPYGDSGRSGGGGSARQGMPGGNRSGLVRGPRGM